MPISIKKLRIVIEMSLTYALADITLKLTSFLPLTGCAILLSRTKKRISLYNELLSDRRIITEEFIPMIERNRDESLDIVQQLEALIETALASESN